MRNMEEKWEMVSKKRFNGTWYPRESIVKFAARYLQRRVGIEIYDVKKIVQKVLDVGCGNGRHVVFFAEQGFDVYGIDISKEAIEIANAWLAKKGLKANLRLGDAEKLPFNKEVFDAVISDGILDHITYQKAEKVMEEIRKVCVTRGYIHITLRSIEDSEFGRGEKVDHNTFVLQDGYEKGIIQHYFEVDEIEKLLKGFRIFDIELHEEKFPDIFSVDKSFLQSSKGIKKYIDLSKPMNLLKNSRWHITAEKV